MARDLRIAREIQMGILPSDLAAATRGTNLEVDAVIEPARHVGGDLYEVLRTGDQRVVVALGDVSGKGIPAALFMAVAVTVLRTLARHIAEPDEILRRLNDELAAQNPAACSSRFNASCSTSRSGRSPARAPGTTGSSSSPPDSRPGSRSPPPGVRPGSCRAIPSRAKRCRSRQATHSSCSRTGWAKR